jgi:hypothetical protein
MNAPLLPAISHVVSGELLVFAAGILIGGAQDALPAGHDVLGGSLMI